MLLQVAAEYLQAVPVGQHHHVALALATTGVIPGCGEQSGGVGVEAGCRAGHLIHLAGTGQEGTDIGADQHTGQQADGAGDAGAATHPVEHVETGQPAALLCLLIKAAAEHRDGHGLTAPTAPCSLHGPSCLQHADVGLRCATGFAHHNHQSGFEPLAQGGEGAAHTIRIDVIEEVKRQASAWILQGADHQQRAKP